MTGECRGCGAVLSGAYIRVFSPDDVAVDRCLECSSLTERHRERGQGGVRL